MAHQKNIQAQAFEKSRGFGLIEFMVAITIGLILLGGIGYIFLGSRQTFRTQDDFSRIQENVRYALDQVGVEVRMAGYSGCVNLSSIDPKNPTATPALGVIANGVSTVSLVEAMRGYDGSGTWTAPGTAPGNWVPNTGVFVISRASEAGVNLSGNTVPTNANIQLSGNPHNLIPEEALLVSNCLTADLFRATNVSSSGSVTIAHSTSNCTNIGGTACNSTNFLVNKYGDDAELFRMINNTYFIGTNSANPPVPALYRRALDGNAEEMVDNVENIVMRFGIDTDNNFIVDSYVSASAVTDWRQVLTARLSLVFRSNSNNVATQVQPYVVEGTTITPTDRRLRRVATATFGLRNRLP